MRRAGVLITLLAQTAATRSDGFGSSCSVMNAAETEAVEAEPMSLPLPGLNDPITIRRRHVVPPGDKSEVRLKPEFKAPQQNVVC
jgi:hypothetical protein